MTALGVSIKVPIRVFKGRTAFHVEQIIVIMRGAEEGWQKKKNIKFMMNNYYL